MSLNVWIKSNPHYGLQARNKGPGSKVRTQTVLHSPLIYLCCMFDQIWHRGEVIAPRPRRGLRLQGLLSCCRCALIGALLLRLFVRAITQKFVDRFGWNFHGRCSVLSQLKFRAPRPGGAPNVSIFYTRSTSHGVWLRPPNLARSQLLEGHVMWYSALQTQELRPPVAKDPLPN